MLFWGLHYSGKFDERTISYALDYNISDVEKELLTLIETGIIDKYDGEGVALYSLTLDEEKRRPIIEWARPRHASIK
jgi:hypothetical protein